MKKIVKIIADMKANIAGQVPHCNNIASTTCVTVFN